MLLHYSTLLHSMFSSWATSCPYILCTDWQKDLRVVWCYEIEGRHPDIQRGWGLSLKAASKERREDPILTVFCLFVCFPHTSLVWGHTAASKAGLSPSSWTLPGWKYIWRDIYDIAIRAMRDCGHTFNKSCFLGENNKFSEEFTNKCNQEQVAQVWNFPGLVWLYKVLDICHSRMKLAITGDYRTTGQLTHTFCHVTCQSGGHQHRDYNTIFSPLISQKILKHRVSI